MHTAIKAFGLTTLAALPAAVVMYKTNCFRNRTAPNPVNSTTAFITGANSGIGLALTKELLDRDCKIYATYRAEHRSSELFELQKTHPRLSLIVADFETTKSTQQATESSKDVVKDTPIDILFLNAGYFEKNAKTLNTLDGAALLKSLQVNTVAPIMMVKALDKNLTSSRTNTVVCISSRRGSVTRNIEEGYTNRIAYSTSKSALNSACVSMALADRERRILILHPGAVRTNFPSAQPDRISPAESAKGIVKVVESHAQSGAFVDYQGRSLPW